MKNDYGRQVSPRRASGLISRRRALAAVVCLPSLSRAQSSQAVRWVVPFPAGGAIDVLARQFAQDVSKSLGSPIVIENRPGAGGNIGVEQVIRAPADGLTFLVAGFGLATNGSLFPKLAFDPRRDLIGVSFLGTSPMFLVAGPAHPEVTSFQNMLQLAKGANQPLVFGHAGTGTSTHLAIELLSTSASLPIQAIPYKGSTPAVTDLLGGQVGFLIDSPTVLLAHIKAGKVRALAVTTSGRSALLPATPTMREVGIAGYEVSPWYGLFARKGVSSSALSQVQAAVAAAAAIPASRERFAQLGVDLRSSTPSELNEHLAAETEKWSALIRQRGIKAE